MYFAFTFCERITRVKNSHLISLSFSCFPKMQSLTDGVCLKTNKQANSTLHRVNAHLGNQVSCSGWSVTAQKAKGVFIAASSADWVGFSPEKPFSPSLVIHLAAGFVWLLQDRHYPSLLVVSTHKTYLIYLKYAKPLFYIAISASTGTVSTDYFQGSHLYLMSHPAGGTPRRTTWSSPVPTQHTGRASPKVLA